MTLWSNWHLQLFLFSLVGCPQSPKKVLQVIHFSWVRKVPQAVFEALAFRLRGQFLLLFLNEKAENTSATHPTRTPMDSIRLGPRQRLVAFGRLLNAKFACGVRPRPAHCDWSRSSCRNRCSSPVPTLCDCDSPYSSVQRRRGSPNGRSIAFFIALRAVKYLNGHCRHCR